MTVEVDVLGSPSATVLMVSVDVTHHEGRIGQILRQSVTFFTFFFLVFSFFVTFYLLSSFPASASIFCQSSCSVVIWLLFLEILTASYVYTCLSIYLHVIYTSAYICVCAFARARRCVYLSLSLSLFFFLLCFLLFVFRGDP